MEIKINVADREVGNISDGYHTFNDLYDHRSILFCSLLMSFKKFLPIESSGIFKTKIDDNGNTLPGWFIAGCDLGHGQITYHLPMRYWDTLSIPEIQRNHKYDQHTSDMVLHRLSEFCERNKNQ